MKNYQLRGIIIIDKSAWFNLKSHQASGALILVFLLKIWFVFPFPYLLGELYVGDTLLDISFTSSQYLVDLYNAALTRQGCVLTMERALDTKVDNITKVQKSECPYSPDVTEWSYDPCCYIRAEVSFNFDTTKRFFEFNFFFLSFEGCILL